MFGYYSLIIVFAIRRVRSDFVTMNPTKIVAFHAITRLSELKKRKRSRVTAYTGLAAEQVKVLQLLQEENNQLRNETKVLQDIRKSQWELCWVHDRQKTIRKYK